MKNSLVIKYVCTNVDVNFWNGEIYHSGLSIVWDNWLAFGSGELELTVDDDGKVIIKNSISKKHFLDSMSKLYDMAEKK